jgi:hypothetical protein
VRWGFFFAVATVTSLVWAEPEPEELAVARALFEDARALMAKGEYVPACPKLERALRILPGSGTKYNLAVCYEHVDRMASAWGLYLDVANAEQLAGHPDRERAARDAATAIVSRVPRLVIVPRSSRTEVRRNGAKVDQGLFGESIPVDPGVHLVEASAAGHRNWSEKVTLTDGQTVRVEIPELEVITTPAPPIAVVTTQRRPYLPVAITLGVAGLAWLGTAGAFTGVSVAEYSEAGSHCLGNKCDARGVSLRDDSITHGNVATVAFVLGIGSIAAGVVLALLPPVHTKTLGVRPGGMVAQW